MSKSAPHWRFEKLKSFTVTVNGEEFLSSKFVSRMAAIRAKTEWCFDFQPFFNRYSKDTFNTFWYFGKMGVRKKSFKQYYPN